MILGYASLIERIGMIYIKESVSEDNTVTIRLDGILDSQSIPILKNVY